MRFTFVFCHTARFRTIHRTNQRGLLDQGVALLVSNPEASRRTTSVAYVLYVHICTILSLHGYTMMRDFPSNPFYRYISRRF